MPWSSAVPAVLVALVALYWPAPALFAALRLPPLASAALAPHVAVLVLSVSAILADVAGGLWGWPWVLGVAVLLLGGVVGGRSLVRRGRLPAAEADSFGGVAQVPHQRAHRIGIGPDFR